MTTKKRKSLGNLVEKLRSTNINLREGSAIGGGSFLTSAFTEDQFGWLEDFQDCWVEMFALPFGDNLILEASAQIIQVKEIPDFIKEHETMNIWRSWIIWKDHEQKDCIGEVPFWLDIDDKDQNLYNAREITQTCLELLLENNICSKDSNRIRIGFSGKKGFHIYINPTVTFDGREFKKDLADQVWNKLGIRRPETFGPTNTFFGSTVIDVIHYHIRIMGSMHSWTEEDGTIIARQTYEMTFDEFMSLNIEDILKRSNEFNRNIP